MGRAGLEPATKCLKGACSTIELTTRLGEPKTIAHPPMTQQGVLGILREPRTVFPMNETSGTRPARKVPLQQRSLTGEKRLDSLFAALFGADTDGFLDRK